MSTHRLRVLIFTIPLFVVALFLCIKLAAPDTYTCLIREDSEIEYMQSLFYFLAAVFAFFASKNLLGKRIFLPGVVCAILAAGLLFISLEEISWGQRIFKIETPAFFKQHNAQKELSVHNLMPVQSRIHKLYMLIGAYGAFAWIIAALAVPGSRARSLHIVNFTVVPWHISSYFFIAFFWYTVFEFSERPHPGSFLAWRDQEPVELLLSLGFLLFAVSGYLRTQPGINGWTAAAGRSAAARKDANYP